MIIEGIFHITNLYLMIVFKSVHVSITITLPKMPSAEIMSDISFSLLETVVRLSKVAKAYV